MNEMTKEKKGRPVWDPNAFVVCVMKRENKNKKEKEKRETWISITELKSGFSILKW